MTACQARMQSDGEMHCSACRVRWDRDDEPACPLAVFEESPSIAPREPFVSALAPDATRRRNYV